MWLQLLKHQSVDATQGFKNAFFSVALTFSQRAGGTLQLSLNPPNECGGSQTLRGVLCNIRARPARRCSLHATDTTKLEGGENFVRAQVRVGADSRRASDQIAQRARPREMFHFLSAPHCNNTWGKKIQEKQGGVR